MSDHSEQFPIFLMIDEAAHIQPQFSKGGLRSGKTVMTKALVGAVFGEEFLSKYGLTDSELIDWVTSVGMTQDSVKSLIRYLDSGTPFSWALEMESQATEDAGEPVSSSGRTVASRQKSIFRDASSSIVMGATGRGKSSYWAHNYLQHHPSFARNESSSESS